MLYIFFYLFSCLRTFRGFCCGDFRAGVVLLLMGSCGASEHRRYEMVGT